jgi:release factor glutamine methyltransferase
VATEVRALLDEGAAHLRRVAGDDARREAEVLLADALGRSRAWLAAHADEPILDCEATDRYEAHLVRRAHGVPVAYLLGRQEFWSLSLDVGPAVLVPRPDTELLVERALAHLPSDRDTTMLDLATGSGAIALAVASERPRCAVTATDLSAEALAVAASNARRLGLDKVECLAGDWYAPVEGRRYDVVASNPPYIALDDPRVEPGVRRHEPHLALYSGPTGLEAIDRVVSGAPAHLHRGGWLLVEHGDRQGEPVRALFAAAGLESISTHRDLGGRERCTEGRRPA